MVPVFFDQIVSLFSKNKEDPELEKKRLLKHLRRDLSQSKFNKFYKLRSEELEPAAAKFFYDMYKIVSSAQLFMQNSTQSTLLKETTIEAFMEKELLEAKERLSPQVIEERAKTVAPQELSRQVKKELATFVAAFDAGHIDAIDQAYNLILIFIHFVSFNFYALLKKFDPKLTEHNFNYQPQFTHIKAASVIENLKDFLEIAYPVETDQDWQTVRKVLRAYKGDVEVLNFDQWRKLLNHLQEVQKTSILVLIVRHVGKDPIWQSKPNIPSEHIAETYLETMRFEVEESIDKIVNAQRNAKIAAIAKTIFGVVNITRLTYYTERENEIYIKKNLGGFTYIAPMNYLKAFMLDYYKKDIRELCELFLIRGQWTTRDVSKQMSDKFYEIMEFSERLMSFDGALGNDGLHGSRLRIAMLKSDRDKSQLKLITGILNVINEEARRILIEVTKSLVVVGKYLKTILDDCQKNPHTLLINWQELESVSDTPIDQQLVNAYKNIYNFVQMMQLFMKPSGE
ncbi:MAG: DUF5312 family protein [Treponema sp.]|jgi:hypothetical protein|nr:DUF5312 family protein [Treponema sp.]